MCKHFEVESSVEFMEKGQLNAKERSMRRQAESYEMTQT